MQEINSSLMFRNCNYSGFTLAEIYHFIFEYVETQKMISKKGILSFSTNINR